MFDLSHLMRLCRIFYRKLQHFQSSSHEDDSCRDLNQKLKFLFIFSVILCCIFLGYQYSCDKKEIPPATEDFTQTVDASLESLIPQALLKLETQCQEGKIVLNDFTLKGKEGLEELLERAKVPSEKRQNILASFSTISDITKVSGGDTFYVFTDKNGNFLGIVAYHDDATFGVIEQEDGTCLPVQHSLPVKLNTKRIQGRIERTFSGSVKKAGLPASLVPEIMNALGGEIDFYSDFQKGDAFDIYYQVQTTPTGLEIGEKTPVFVGLDTKKRKLYKYAYKKGNSFSFYNAQGESGEKVIIKRPLKGKSRVSSPYGNRRHPILLYTIFHHGVDLASPMNTPIIAAADGTITMIGRRGSYGKYIKIKHKDGFETAYAHLNGYRKGLRKGSYVKQGDVIGYVGSTGRSTGPHLHFEVLKNKKTLHPFKTHVIPGTKLNGKELVAFQEQAKLLHPDFMKHLVGKIAPPPLPRPSE